MIAHLEELLLHLVDTLPLEMFVFVASFVEEVIAPIPSPTVMVLSGSFASMQDYAYGGLLLLAVIGALGKTSGAFFVYHIADTLEDLFITRFGKFFGVTSEDITTLGKKLTGTTRDYVLLTVFRSMPFIPSSVVSVGCGVLRVPMRLFIVSTFLGTIIRDGVYLYAGYAGIKILEKIIHVSDRAESLITFGVIAALVALVFWLYWRTKNHASNIRE